MTEQRTVGGTLVPRILGLSKWGGPLSAYYELTQGVTPESEPAMRRGNVLEASVLRMLERRLDIVCMRWGCVRPDGMPYAHATLDALAAGGPLGHLVDGDRTIVDAKTLAAEQMGSEWGADGTDRLLREYQIQILWYHGVCRAAGLRVAEDALVPVLIAPESELALLARLVERTGKPLEPEDLDGTRAELRVYKVIWDEDLFSKIRTRVLWFLKHHVDARRPPQPGDGDLPDRDLEAVAHGIQGKPGEAMDFGKLHPAAQATVAELLEAVQERKRWTELEKQAGARVKLIMGEAEELRGLDGGARVLWKTIKGGSRRFEVKEPRK